MTAIHPLTEVLVGDLLPNPWDPRKARSPEAVREMAESIRQVGLLQPLVVRPAHGQDGKYEMAFGMTRHLAIKLLQEAGQTKMAGVPVQVRALTDADMAIIALTENSRRTDLTPMEMYRAYQKALEEIPHLTIAHLAESLGLDRSTLSNNLRLLKLPGFVLERVDSGEMSAHAARELLCLVAEDHAHEDIMKSIIQEVANTSLGAAPDWRASNVRRLIRERVGESTVEHWRRLGTLSGGRFNPYGSSHRIDPEFDVVAFQAECPLRVHLLPWDDWDRDSKGYRETKERTLAWTCAPKEWERRQAAAKRAAETGGEKPEPKGPDLALQGALRNDPVFKQVAREVAPPLVSLETPPAAPAPPEPNSPVTLHSREPEEHPGMVRLEYLAYSPEGAGPRFIYIAPSWVTAVTQDQEGPYVAWKEPRRRQSLSAHITAETCQALVSRPELFRSAPKTPKAAQTVNVSAMSPEQRERLGSRGKMVNLARVRGVHRPLSRSHYNAPPAYFPELDECLKRCTKGATYCQGDDQTPSLYCLNEECWQGKETRGKQEFGEKVKAEAQRQDAEDRKRAARVAERLGDAALARLVATALLVTGKYEAYAPANLREFQYEPGTLARVRELLRLPPGDRSNPWRFECLPSTKKTLDALRSASDESLSEVAAQLLVYAFRTHDPKHPGPPLEDMES